MFYVDRVVKKKKMVVTNGLVDTIFNCLVNGKKESLAPNLI